MGLANDLLTILSGSPRGYQPAHDRARGYTGGHDARHLTHASEAAIRVTLSRLKRRGLVENERGVWHLTKQGLSYLADKLHFHSSPRSHANRNSKEKSMIIAFDIPERYRRKRHWLRIELINLGFEMLQKSVWLGPTPLPEEFVRTLTELNIISYMKFFEVRLRDLI